MSVEPRDQPLVTVTLDDLKNSSVSFSTLDDAFGQSSLGILLVKDLPLRFSSLRLKLLSYASYLANLPQHELDQLSSPSSSYLIGWSHGKETLKSGFYDTLKGSFYVNCGSFKHANPQTHTSSPSPQGHEYTGDNIWPREELLPGFRQTFEELSSLIIDVASLVARACDNYAAMAITGYKAGYLQAMVETSSTTKARLLHYYPPEHTTRSDPPPDSSVSPQETPHADDPDQSEIKDQDSWCATHIDHGCLTALISALYIDESAHLPQHPYPSSNSDEPNNHHLPALPPVNAPSPSAGLYIQSRTSTITKVTIPPDCLAFQTGEALQLITEGKFRAAPHFVRAGAVASRDDGRRIARNTLAIFMQPELEEVVNRRTGLKFGEFCQEVANRFK